MSSSPPAMVTPSVLRWARESAGYALEEAARRLKVDQERLTAWESEGDAHPSMAKLSDIGRLYRRPTALFFLDAPPQEAAPPTDYRTLPGNSQWRLSPELRRMIRMARERQAWARNYREDLATSPCPLVGFGDLQGDAAAAARQARELLGVPLATQATWRKPDTALRAWRGAVEASGVLVFRTGQASVSVPLEEMRGIALPDAVAPVVVLNGQDASAGQIFSLMHELGHLALCVDGISGGGDPAGRSPVPAVEAFCNRFAAELLVPAADLLSQNGWTGSGSQVPSSLDVRQLAARYAVSEEVLVLRLVELGLVARAYYDQWKQNRPAVTEPRRSDAPVAIKRHVLVLSAYGKEFARLVVRAHGEDRVTLHDVSRLLNAKIEHLTALEQHAFGDAPATA